VLVGYGGAGWGEIINAGWKFGAQPRRLLTFSVDGHAVLPPTAPPDMSVLPLGMPKFDTLTREQVNQIFSYIRAGAREALGLRNAAPPGSGKL
jgi:hypothetical protein